MLKICYLLDFSVFKVDGPTINEVEFINSLERQNDIEVIYFTTRDNKKIISESNCSKSFFFKNNTKDRVIKYIPKTFILFLKFIFFYLNNPPDIIVTRLGSIPSLQFFITLLFSKKLYIKTASRFWGVQHKRNFLDNLFQKFLYNMNKFIFAQCKGIDTVTEKFCSIFENEYNIPKDKIAVIENSVNSSNFYPQKNIKCEKLQKIKDCFPVLGYVGNVPSERGAKQIIQVYERLKNKYPKISIVVVGSDENISNLINYVAEKKYTNIFFLNVVPYQDIPDIVNCLDIGYSFTTQYDLNEVGNSSQKLRQYISCGKPVITMQGTNQFVFNDDLGSLVDQNNIDEIAAETEKWAQRVQSEGDALRDRLHAYACKHLSTEKTFQQRLEFWNYLLEN
jgi:glycosyltransferase involved in cell wall biosynthesis